MHKCGGIGVVVVIYNLESDNPSTAHLIYGLLSNLKQSYNFNIYFSQLAISYFNLSFKSLRNN